MRIIKNITRKELIKPIPKCEDCAAFQHYTDNDGLNIYCNLRGHTKNQVCKQFLRGDYFNSEISKAGKPLSCAGCIERRASYALEDPQIYCDKHVTWREDIRCEHYHTVQ